ncbi:hypothetical protein [Actinokineospora inagensis]|uniref:hypothetical protein n=1 Tax=Actinokineospora inagensis TaxID=103730 RepID=UPI000422EA84|nr:hypothetical protein [Actinokineospora inagensis]
MPTTPVSPDPHTPEGSGASAGPAPQSNAPEAGEPAKRRRPTLDEIFGDVLPDTTADERDPTTPAATPDDWYLRNRPPHHGG